MSQQITTFQQLADLINKNQEKTDQRFELLDKRLDKEFKVIDERFKKVDEKFNSIDQKFDDLTELMLNCFDKVYKQFDFNKRITTLETKMEVVKEKLDLKFT